MMRPVLFRWRGVRLEAYPTMLYIGIVSGVIADKESVLRGLLARLGVKAAETAVMGDDLPDLPLMRIAGLAMSPADAVPEVRRAAGWVSRWVGGHGAVREAVELLLRSRKSWPPLK